MVGIDLFVAEIFFFNNLNYSNEDTDFTFCFSISNSVLLGSGTDSKLNGQCLQPYPQQKPLSKWYFSVNTI